MRGTGKAGLFLWVCPVILARDGVVASGLLRPGEKSMNFSVKLLCSHQGPCLSFCHARETPGDHTGLGSFFWGFGVVLRGFWRPKGNRGTMPGTSVGIWPPSLSDYDACLVFWPCRAFEGNNGRPKCGAVLSLLDGPPGCDPGFYVIWCRFRLLRMYLAFRPLEIPGLYSLLGLVAGGCPGHGPMHLLVESAGIIGFSWDPVNAGWSRPGLPVLQHLAAPYQHFKAAIWDAWRFKVSFDLCRRQGFRAGPMLDKAGSLQLLHAPHVRERDKAMLRSIMVGCVGNRFLLGHARGEIVPCRFCGGFDGDEHLFGNVLIPIWLKLVNILSFTI